MSRASEYARAIKAARQGSPEPFILFDDAIASLDEDGNLFLLPRLTRLMPADVQRFLAWLHNAFDEEPF